MEEINKNKTMLNREDILCKMADIIEVAHKKVMEGRYKEDVDKNRREWSKVLSQVSNVFLSGLKDMEIEAIKDRLSILESGKNATNIEQN